MLELTFAPSFLVARAINQTLLDAEFSRAPFAKSV